VVFFFFNQQYLFILQCLHGEQIIHLIIYNINFKYEITIKLKCNENKFPGTKNPILCF